MKKLILDSNPVNKIRFALGIKKAIDAWDPAACRITRPGPFSIQIQTIDRCNGRCVMCPYTTKQHTGPANRMDPKLFVHIMKELKKTRTLRFMGIMLQNEPLMDSNLADRVLDARRIHGNGVSINTVTNGTLLTVKRAEELAQAGIDNVSVSINAFEKDTYNHIQQGLDYEKVTTNVEAALELDNGPHITARFLVQNANRGELKDFISYWRSRGAGVFSHEVSNRAGNLETYDKVKLRRHGLVSRLMNRVQLSVFPFCEYPFFAMSIRWDGCVILCCHDWGHEVIMGDFTKQTLPEIWNGEIINHYRRLLYEGRVRDIRTCSECSYGLSFTGK